jgi:hypothetical protein
VETGGLKQAGLVVNEEMTKEITAKVESANAGSFVMVTPEQPEARATSALVRIPPRSAIVLLEQ